MFPSRFVLLLIALCALPLPGSGCTIMEPLEEQIASAFNSSVYVFVGRVGRTMREASNDSRFESVLIADITVIEAFKGRLKAASLAPMRLGQLSDGHSLAFAWEGDRILVYASRLPVTEEHFSWCGPGTTTLGDDDRPRLDSEEIEILRKLARRAES
jgi:hypothetical protein